MKKKDLFKDHNDWVFSKYTAHNTKTGAYLWIGNGVFFFNGYLGTLHFGVIERFFLWRHFNNMRTRKALGLPY